MKHIKKSVFSLIILLVSFSVQAQEKTLETLQENITDKSTFFEIDVAARKLWGESFDQTRASEKEQKSYKKYLRWRTFWQTRLDENGGFSGPSNAIVEHNKSNKSISSKAASTPELWTPIGPYGIDVRTSSSSGGLLMGNFRGGIGAIHAATSDPNNDQILYAASNMGGLFKSTNGGEYWWNISDSYLNFNYIGFKDVIVDPDPTKGGQTIYASATGRHGGGFLKKDGTSLGVLKSVNGGSTWSNLNDNTSNLSNSPTSLTTLDFESDPDNSGDFRMIEEIVLHPTNGNLYMLVAEGPWDSPKTTLYESANGTNSWSLKKIFYNERLREIKILPFNTDLLFISGLGGSIYKYNHATGVSLNLGNELNTALGLTLSSNSEVVVETTDDDPNMVYIFVVPTPGSPYSSGLSYFIKYDHSLLAFTTAPTIITTQYYTGGGVYQLRVSDVDKNNVYFAKGDLFGSTNNGASFSKQNSDNSPGGSIVHADFNSIDFFKGTNNMIIGNDGGLIKREETSPNTYTNKYVSGCGLLIAKPYSLWLDERFSSKFLIGMHDNNSALYNNGAWTSIGGGDGGLSMISQSGGLLYAGNSNLFGLKTGIYNQQRRFHPEDSEYAMCHGTTNAYTPTLSIKKPTGWEPYSPVFTGIHPFSGNTANLLVRSFDVCEVDPSVCYAYGTYWWFQNLKMYRGNNGQSTNSNDWQEVNAPPVASQRNVITSVLAHPFDPDKVWTTFGFYNNNEKVYYSSNGGQSWENHSLGLPNFPVNHIVMDKNSGYLFLATDVGVYHKKSTDGPNVPWTVYGNGAPKCIVSEIRINHTFNKIVAAHFGRGVWNAKLPCPNGTTNLPNAFNGFYKDGLVYGNTQQNNSETAIVRAMNKITFTTGFKSAPIGNHKLSAKILPCAPEGILDPCSSYQKFVQKSSNAADGIEEFRSNVSVYPNPNNGEFNIDLTEIEGKTNIEVINTVGSIVLSKTVNSEQVVRLDIQNQPNGFYFIKITSGNKVKVEKVIKN